MPCKYISLGGGKYAIVKMAPARKRKCACGLMLSNYKLCDFPMSNGKTCDAVLCGACAHHVDPDTDFCPAHAPGQGGEQSALDR